MIAGREIHGTTRLLKRPQNFNKIKFKKSTTGSRLEPNLGNRPEARRPERAAIREQRRPGGARAPAVDAGPGRVCGSGAGAADLW